MRRMNPRLRLLFIATLSGLAFEFVAFSDLDGARADDLHLLISGGVSGGGGSTPPANIVFLFDNSRSMHNLVCQNLPSGAGRCCLESDFLSGCGSSDVTGELQTKSAPNGATICEQRELAKAIGPDRTGDGVSDTYQGRYASDGVTVQGTPYPIFDLRGSSSTDDLVPAGATLSHSAYSAFTTRQTGTGSTTMGQINSAISQECNQTNCNAKSRCIYSLRTLGYFHEPSGASCDSGDPMTMCSPPAAGQLGAACTANGQCASNRCVSSKCSQCANNGQCSGGGNSCSTSGCQYSYCTLTGCVAPTSSGSFSGTSTAVFLGDYINFSPPKSYALVKAFVDTINNMTGDARMGISDFTDVGSGTIAHDIKPPCSQSGGTNCFDGDPATVCFDPSNAQLINYLHNSLSFNSFTPLAKALDNVGQYYTTPTGSNTPMCDYSAVTSCSTNNFVVIISDGLPFVDATSASGVPFVNGKISGFSDGYYKNNSYYVDDVAKALTVIDHRTFSGTQSVSTYAVSFGVVDASDPTKCDGLLADTATAGGGECLAATDVNGLREALATVLKQIILRVSGFTAPGVPTTRYTGTAFLSTALFRPSTTFPLWEGHVFGFQMCDKLLGCTKCTAPATVCILDADDNPVQYDSDGYLISKPYWDAQLCLSGDPDGSVGVLPPDQSNLDVSGCYLSASARRIYTAVDGADAGTNLACRTPDTGSGGCTDGDAKIALTAANVAGTSALATALAGASVAASQKVVNFYRGFDTDDLNGDGSTTDDRNMKTMRDGSGKLLSGWWKLGDIFHSIPNVVERPTTLGMGAWGSTVAFTEFATDNTARAKAMIVGANDGMLHAFQAGAWDASANAGKGAYDQGTGEELWAFVSPEVLPKLKSACDPGGGSCSVSDHRFLMDSSVMVRDMWMGGSADKNDTANKTKWRTVAVYGHRDGGRTYVALDVTDITNPIFLWQFPQPGTSDEASMGLTWLDTFPAPASIGPLQVKTATGTIYDLWVVLLSGGFDQTDRRGNSLYMLDAYTGALVWKATQTSDSSATDSMRYAFAATPVYYSKIGGSFPYIAGIVAADHGGQIWHVPIDSVPVATATPYAFTPKLAFRTVDPLGNTDKVGGDNDSILDFAEYQSLPFFFAPTLTRKEGRVRVIIGTGDRDMLIPHGDLPPTDGSVGTVCDSAADCNGGLVCTNNRCSSCVNSGSCTGGNTCTSTGCLYSRCSNVACAVTDTGTEASPAISNAICKDVQRLYAINLDCVPGGGRTACTEADLQEITIVDPNTNSSTYATAGDQGWFYKMSPGEKVATPFTIFGGYGIYTTFLPTTPCGTGNSCTAGAKGEARLYARHFVSGKPLDWDDNGTIATGEIYQSLGEGVPTAPAVSVAVANGAATPSFVGGSSSGGLVAKQMGGAIEELVTEIMRFPVTKALHDVLHQ